MQRVHTDERGAVAVLVGVLLPMLLAMSALGIEVAIVGGGERELQRSADAGALAGAASIPLADSGALAPGVVPGASGGVIKACEIAEDNLAAARLTQGFAVENPTCDGGHVTATAEPDDPDLLAVLSDLVDDELPLTSLLDELGLPVDPAAVAPAVTHPRVRVTAEAGYASPLIGLLDAVRADAVVEGVARRRIKNAVLLPVVELEADCSGGGGLIGGLVDVLTGTLEELLGTSDDLPTDLAEVLESDCDVTFDANPLLDMTGQEVIDALEALKEPLEYVLGPAGPQIIDALILDLRDVYDPGSDAPTQGAVLKAAADRNENVLVFTVGTTNGTQIPILDVVPVAAQELSDLLADESTELEDVLGLTRATEMGGIFRATLVE